MKKNILLIIVLLISALFIGACQQDSNTQENVKNDGKVNSSVKEDEGIEETEEERLKRQESGLNLYGEGVKDKDYGITLQTAYSETNIFRESKTDKPFAVNAVVKVANATDQQVNASNIGFTLTSENSSNSYTGELFSSMNPSDLELNPEESVYLQVTFEVDAIEPAYMFSVGVFNNPNWEEVKWKVEDLEEPN
ncbi:hypothetical protein Pryu01_01576 [Paraliobacillus ryukyuensis]|uniref:DUF4352 domain-containing protein n=1 Tax=Paraliobacillus ryukyuensis TaxID=200904 RepID=A0A366EDU8_9BACI|nr:hypothetical protein [Paraliobacillus ryukyuensis]RBO99919.1 hypothetical protein DES48_103247 [Paraliobacillus ryukyuensis]